MKIYIHVGERGFGSILKGLKYDGKRPDLILIEENEISGENGWGKSFKTTIEYIEKIIKNAINEGGIIVLGDTILIKKGQ